MSISFLAAILFTTAPAMALVTIDFEDAPIGDFASWTKDAVTFTAVGGAMLVSGDNVHGYYAVTPNGSRGLIGYEPSIAFYSPELRADIAGGTNYVAVDLGDYKVDSDRLFLEVFDSSNMSLGFTDLVIPSDFEGMQTLSLSASNISYAIFGARAVSGDYIGSSSVYADNFTFAAGAVIPVPGAVLLSGIGVALVGWLKRKRTF